jgi:signal transduction histidine kinase
MSSGCERLVAYVRRRNGKGRATSIGAGEEPPDGRCAADGGSVRWSMMDKVSRVAKPIGRGGSWLSRQLGDAGPRDLFLPAALLVVQLAGAATVGGHHSSGQPLGAAGWILMMVGPLALVFRRRWPVGVLWVALAATLTPWGAWPADLSLIVAFFVVAGYVSSVWLKPLAFDETAASLAFALGLAGWLGVLVVTAEVVRLRRERNATVRAARDLDARQRASEERLAMARDLHDVIGHNVSLINVQAAVALDLMEGRPEQARVALTAIESASRDVLDELRTVLAAFRGEDKAPRAPVPSLDRVDELVELTRAAGMTVNLEVVGDRRQLPVAVEVAGYRVVQESLTNAVRHAARAATCVRLTYRPDGLDIEVSDEGRPGAVSGMMRPGSGSGIDGMRERVAALGGQFRAGPRLAGGFAVSAHLPLGGLS